MKRVQADKDNLPIQCMAAETGASGLAGEKRRFRIRPITIASCALLLALLFSVAFHAVGLGMWRLTFSWDDETMDVLVDIQGKITGRGYKNDLEAVPNDAYFRKLDEMEVIPLLPSWMPDGFVLEKIESKIENEYYRWAVGLYACVERGLKISVVKKTVANSGGVWSLEKDEREPDIYERGGVEFCIFDNLSRARAFWVDPPYIISITGHLSRDELKQMIDSMFERK